ncbi:hypothetical protein [Bhargavaea cecembensis]|uniref:hypothetical protein n=1 Tax=Bhargavaea cecembensis TaxID=394098 RepID=UPI0006937C09|nr:hypothetical protein [Bhargavaea cecembensis]
MQVISLSSLIEASHDDEEVHRYISTFSSERNEEVQGFLHDKAIYCERRSLTRTSLIVDEENNNEIIGYFALLIKPFKLMNDVSGSTRNKLTGDKTATVFNSILIAQLGRSDLYKGKVSGDVILNLALESCQLAYDLVALRIVCVEFDDIPVLKEFYQSGGFKILQFNNNQKVLAYFRF